MRKTKLKEENLDTFSVYGLLKTYVIGIRLIPLIICITLTSVLTFLRPLIIKGLTDEGMLKADMRMICVLAVLLLVLTIAEQIADIMQCKKFVEIQNTMIRALYELSFKKTMRLKKGYFIEHNSAEIINRISTDIRSVSMIADQNILFAIRYVLSILGGMLGLFLLSWKMTLVVIPFIPLKVFLSVKMSQLNEETISENNAMVRSFFSWFGDMINGIKEIKLWNLQGQKVDRLNVQQNEILQTSKRSTLCGCYNRASTLLLSAFIQSLLYICGGILFIRGELSLGGVTAFIAYCGYVLSPISALLSIQYMFSSISPSLRRLNEFFRLEEEAGLLNEPKKESVRNHIPLLELQHVKFSHTREDLLVDINFTAEKGETIAIIGANGSGKSTLVDLILRFEQPVGGHILIDGRDASTYGRDHYWDLFAVVEQEPYFFKDSLRSNLDPNGMYCDESIRLAFAQCGMQDFLYERLHNDLDQSIRFDAGDFSGGERKKLAIVRAILKNAPILIMDEAAADYDFEAEHQLSHMITSQVTDKLILYITHNYSYLDLFSRVFQLSNGYLKQLTQKQVEGLKKRGVLD